MKQTRDAVLETDGTERQKQGQPAARDGWQVPNSHDGARIGARAGYVTTSVRANLKMVDRFWQPFSSNTSRNKGVLQALVTCASGRFVDNLCARQPRLERE